MESTNLTELTHNPDELKRIFNTNEVSTVAVHCYHKETSPHAFQPLHPGYSHFLTEKYFVRHMNFEAIFALKKHCFIVRRICGYCHSEDNHQGFHTDASDQLRLCNDILKKYVPMLENIENIPIRCIAKDMLKLLLTDSDNKNITNENTLDDAIDLVYAITRSRAFRIVFCPFVEKKNYSIATHWNSEYNIPAKHYGKKIPIVDYSIGP